MTRTSATIALAVVMTVAMATSAFAQTTPTPPASSTTKVIPEKESATPLQSGRSESLSTKLNKSSGVIAPKGDIDPAMRVPAPDPHPGTTRVIPPSATGGTTAK